jgi:hypothetical protein
MREAAGARHAVVREEKQVARELESTLGRRRRHEEIDELPWTHMLEQTKGSADWFAKVHRYLRPELRAVPHTA